MKKQHKNKKQGGFSLIELMVTMLIGLFLLGAIFTIYVGSKKSYVAQQQFLRLEDTGRNALFELTNIIQHAGYRTASLFPIGEYFITATPTATACDSSGVNSTNTNIANAANIKTVSDATSDNIGIVYFGDSQLNEDCTGTALPADCEIGTALSPDAAKIYSSFDIVMDADGTTPLLRCTGSLQGTAVTLVKGVEKMQINYGVDKDLDGRVDNYMNATTVNAETAWNQVISVQVAILVRTLKKVKENAEAQSYVLLDKKYDIPADRYHRAVFTTMIRLPNARS